MIHEGNTQVQCCWLHIGWPIGTTSTMSLVITFSFRYYNRLNLLLPNLLLEKLVSLSFQQPFLTQNNTRKMFSTIISLAILAGEVVNAAVNSPRQNSYAVVTVTLTTTVPNAALMNTTPQISSQEVAFITITDTTYVLPENTGFVGAPNAGSAASFAIYNSSLFAQPTAPYLNASSTEIPTSAPYFSPPIAVVQTTMPYPNTSTIGIPTSSNDLTNPIAYLATSTDTTTIVHVPNHPTFPANASSFYFPKILSTTAGLVNASSTTLAVELITDTLLSAIESEVHMLQSVAEAPSLTSLVSYALSTPPVKVVVQIITTVRSAYIYSLSGRPIYTSPSSTIIYTSFPPGVSFQAAGPAPGLSSTKPDSPASSIFLIMTSKPAPPATSTVPPAPPVSSTKAPSSSFGYPAGFSQGAHCPFPYPGESCAWNGQAATKVTRSTMETKASEALQSTETGKCLYPGQKC